MRIYHRILGVAGGAALAAVIVGVFVSNVAAQQVGDWVAEKHLPLTTWKCTTSGGCKSQNTSVVLDSRKRYMHVRESTIKCVLSDGSLNKSLCTDSENCHNNCVYEGIDNYASFGLHTYNTGDKNSSIKLDEMVGQWIVDPRVYLLASSGDAYEMITMSPGQEFTFEVDVSLTVGLVSAMYLIEMASNGSKNKYSDAGAAYGEGYCDAQCPVRPFIDGQVNFNDSGVCCGEFDFWEATNLWTKLASHPCLGFTGIYGATKEQYTSNPGEGGVCARYGGGLSMLMDNGFYGPLEKINTNKPFTVVTQFLGAQDVAQSDLSSTNKKFSQALSVIRRIYIQDNQVIKTSTASTATSGDMVITPDTVKGSYLDAAGGLPATNSLLSRGMALALSVYGGSNNMTLKPSVTYSNIRWGDLYSTYKEDGSAW